MAGLSIEGGGHIDRLEGAAGRFHAGLQQAAHMVGQMLVRATQSGMQSAGGGRIYPNAKRQSSAAGGYPAVQSGQLYGSLGYEVHGSSRLEYGSRGAFNKGFDYAIAQHEGTSKMAPRPFATLTVTKLQGEITHRLGTVVWSKLIGGG